MKDIDYIIKGYKLTTINILYYRLDFLHLLQEFQWQTYDLYPKFPRMTSFIDYWDQNIKAPIEEIKIYQQDKLINSYRNIKEIKWRDK